MLVVCVMIPLLLLGVASYYSMFSLLNDRLQSGIRNDLSQVRTTLENTLENLNDVSQQLAYQDVISRILYEYFDTTGLYDKATTISSLSSQVSLIEFTNKNISNITYYYKDLQGAYRKIINTPTGSELPLGNRMLSSRNGVTFFGPHKTSSILSDYLVISTMKTYKLPHIPEVYIYLESGYQQIEKVISGARYNVRAYHALISSEGDVTYSQNPEVLPVATRLDVVPQVLTDANHAAFYTFVEPSKYGWSILLLLPRSQYNREITTWVVRFIAIALLSLLVSAVIAYRIWRMVYAPIQRLNNELRDIDKTEVVGQLESINVREFDEYLHQFRKMKTQILHLITVVKEEARKKSRLEVQQLFYKINPHFLHNTLDTIKWYSDMRGQEDIVKLISSLNKLLVYNLKSGEESTLKEEVAAIDDYIVLQSIKYDLTFEKQINVSSSLLEARSPKFILQPIVENAIYHGVEGAGRIILEVDGTAEGIVITISDNGNGMSAEKLEAVLGKERDEEAGSIGLQYVRKTLDHMFEGRAKFRMSSSAGKGCVVEITIPAGTGGTDGC